MIFRLRRVPLVLLLLTVNPNGAGAQDLPIPGADWMSIETEHFVVHFPSEMSEWALSMSARLGSIHDAVSAMVGYSPAKKVTIIVDDPSNVSNGSAWPGPVIYLWPIPPGPRSVIGENRGWSEILTVHEFAHVAHFTRPSRNPFNRILVKLLPIRIDPIMTGAPRWILEGYATYIEGRLTGSGRPHGTWRPAILRQWALEGQLPTYGELNSSPDFFGGSMAYLAGSAFIEWLVVKSGEESLPNLWRRMTSRKKRSFNDAFAGVFGGPPNELYGRFAAELTGKALEIEEELSRIGIEEGQLVQRLNWFTGDPAISPDGGHIAVVIRSRDQFPRLVVWKWDEEPPSDKELERGERIRQRDPEDVPDIEWKPRDKKPVVTLYPSGGRAFSKPRFMPDGKQLLVIRPEALPDGRIRPDLFIWDFERGNVRRVTRQGAIHEADPSPDGKAAVGIQCLNGSCDIVRIDLETGRITLLQKSRLDQGYYRPRFSPDGNQIVASRQIGSIWQLVVMNSDGSELRTVATENDISRFDAEYTSDGRSLVCVSSRGGVLNLELLDLDSETTRPLTRVTGAAFAPAINTADDSVLFLNLRSRGYDLHNVGMEGGRLDYYEEAGADYSPAARIPVISVPGFPEGGAGFPGAYRLGPRKYILLPQGSFAREGGSFGLVLGSSDPVGRLGWTLGGLVGNGSTWQGGSFRVAWRGWGPVINAEVFSARQYPSKNEEDLVTQPELDVEYSGADFYIELQRNRISRSCRYWLGASAGQIDGPAIDSAGRQFAFGGLHQRHRQTPGNRLLTESLRIEAAAGKTDGLEWNRFLASFSFGLGKPGKSLLSGEVTYGETGGDPNSFEEFSVGGLRPMLFDGSILSQRIPMPALPTGFLSGPRYASYRGDLSFGSLLFLYYWAGMAGEKLEGWEKIFGQEIILDSAAVPFLRIPGVQFRLGSGIRVDDPYPKKTRFYFGMFWRP